MTRQHFSIFAILLVSACGQNSTHDQAQENLQNKATPVSIDCSQYHLQGKDPAEIGRELGLRNVTISAELALTIYQACKP